MTLNTRFYITTDGIDPGTVWNALLDMVEPEDFQRTREDYTEVSDAPSWGPKGAIRTNTKVGIGLNAWCFMHHNTDGSEIPLDDDETSDIDREDLEVGQFFVPQSFIRLAFDTVYGYRGPNNEGCSDLHGRIVTRLAEIVTSMGGEYAWHDEYEGKWYTDLDHIPDFGKF